MNDKDALAAAVVPLERGCISQDMDGVGEAVARNALKGAGVKELMRLDIPNRDPHAYPAFASLLRELAYHIEAIGKATHLNYYEQCRDAAQQVKSTHNKMKAISKTPQFWAGRK